MNQKEKKHIDSILEEPQGQYLKIFSSQEEAEQFNILRNVEMSDMDKFKLFCNMLRMERIYKKAKIYDYKDIKK